MSRGNSILINQLDSYHGKFVEGIIGAALTPKPGTVMQYDLSVAIAGGRNNWKVYGSGTDGLKSKGPYIVLREDAYQGRLATTAYAAAEHCFGYIPLPGDELNMLILDIAGTGDDHTIGEGLMVDDPTGKLIARSGSPQVDFAVLRETITDPTADTLAWVEVS